MGLVLRPQSKRLSFRPPLIIASGCAALCILVVLARWLYIDPFILVLANKAWESSVSSMGTTTLAIVGSLLYPLSDVMLEQRHHGWLGVRQHWKERLKYSAAIAAVWWCMLFCYHLFFTVPNYINQTFASLRTPDIPKPPPVPEPPKELPGPVAQNPDVIKLAPYIIAKRRYQRFSDSNEVKWTEYGIGAVLRIQNPSSTPENVSRLNLSGDVSVDCASYDTFMGDETLGKNHNAQLRLGDFGPECNERQPFYRLSWVAYPIGQNNRVDPNGGEQFIRFRISPPKGLYRIRNGDFSEYIGFRNPATAPRLLTTVPHVEDLVTFARSAPANSGAPHELSGPTLRPEVRDGRIQFKVLLNTNEVTIKPFNYPRYSLDTGILLE